MIGVLQDLFKLLIFVKVYYFPRILTTDLGMAHETSLHLAAGLSVTYWIFSFIPWLWLDKISRRKPLILGALGCSLCFFVVSPPSDWLFSLCSVDSRY